MVRRTLHDGSSTVYIGGVYEATYSAAGVLTGVVKYYTAFGRPVCVRQATSDSDPGTLSYLLADHLGSTVGVMDANGTVVARQTCWPYGAVRAGGVAQTDRRYTGQRQEAAQQALGLYDYRARFYSTLVGRFVSADPVVPHTYDPQAWNAYSYVENNPLARTDPTGERQCEPDGPCNGGDQTPYDGGPAPCDALCVGLKQLAALNIFSPEDLAAYQYRQALQAQRARDLAACAADPAACAALGGVTRDPSTSSPSATNAPCTGFPCADDYASCAQQPAECSLPGTGGSQPLSCAMEGKGCQQGNTMPYGPGDSPWDPSNSGRYYTGVALANAIAHITFNALRSPACDVALGEATVVGGVIVAEAGSTDGVALTVSAGANSPAVADAVANVITNCGG